MLVAPPSSVFTVGAAQAREVLGGGREPRRPHPLDRRSCVLAADRAPAKAREPITAQPGDVGDRREVHVDPGGRAAGSAAARADARTSAGRPLQRLARWPGRPSPTVRTSPPSWSTITSAPLRALRWSARVSRRHSRRRPGVEAEQDHARRLARAQPAADVGRRPRAREARDRQLADLLAQAEAVDRRPRLRCAGAARARRGRGAPSPAPAPTAIADRQRQQPPRRRAAPAAAAPRGHSTAARSGCGHRPPFSSRPAQRQPSVSAASPNPSTGPERAGALQAALGRALGAPREHAAGERVAVHARSARPRASSRPPAS